MSNAEHRASPGSIGHAGVVACLVLVLGLPLVGAGCGSEAPVSFSVPRGGPQVFLDAPWPSDVLVRADGTLDLSAFPNPTGSGALDEYLNLFERAPGFSSSGALYFKVEGGVDEGSLPQSAKDSVADDASVFLVELQAPERKIPIELRVYNDGTTFLPPGSVAVLPLLGTRPVGPAALVVTSRARDKSGAALAPSADMDALLHCRALEPPPANPVDCAPYQALREALWLGFDRIALAQVYTPQDATLGLQRGAAVVTTLPPPRVLSMRKRERAQGLSYDTYEGVVELAQFQAGEPPYTRLDGVTGGFVFDVDGFPVVQRQEAVPFILTVPLVPVPDAGFPIAINGHGTGGDYESGLGRGFSSEATQLAVVDTAMLAVSEPLHRTRAGYRAGQEELLTFNFFNPVAGRDNWRQSALEKMQLVTLAETLAIDSDVSGGPAVTFNADNISYFGHSQGGIVGALFVGVETRITGAFLSGAGAGFAPSLVEKTEPYVISDIVKTALLLPDDEVVDFFHPVLALLQTWVDPADPVNYGTLWRDRDGRAPHLIVTSGLTDSFTPKKTHAGLAGAFRLPVCDPVSEPLEVLELLNVESPGDTLRANLSIGGAAVTAGMLQYPNDGHFAVYFNEGAQRAMRDFFAGLPDAPTVRVAP